MTAICDPHQRVTCKQDSYPSIATATTLSPEKWPAISPADLAQLLDGCVFQSVSTRCQSALQNLEAYTSGIWINAAHKRWEDSLSQSNEWNTAQLTYNPQKQSSHNLQAVVSLVRAAYAATDLSSHGLLLKATTEAEDYDQPGFVQFAPVELNDVWKQIDRERTLARDWVELHLTQVLSGNRSASNALLDVDVLGAIGDAYSDLRESTLARYYYERAAQQTRLLNKNAAIAVWYELQAFETYSSAEKQEHRLQLAEIRSRIPAMLQQARTHASIPKFEQPVIVHMPEGLMNADAETIANYPTVIVPATSTADGLEASGPLEVRNVRSVDMQELGERAIKEGVEQGDWAALRDVITSPWEQVAGQKTQLIEQEPIIIYTPDNSDIVESSAYSGSIEQVRNVEELAWQMSYRLALTDLQDPTAAKQAQSDIGFLEAALFERINRLKYTSVSHDEAYLMTQDLQLVTSRWLSRGGPIESLHMSEGQAAASARLKNDLLPMAKAVQEMSTPYMTNDAKDPSTNVMGQLFWALNWDANLLLDQPQDSIRGVLANVLPRYGKTATVQMRMNQLRTESSWLFDGNAQLDPAVDVSHVPEGERAKMLAASRYWVSDSDVENMAAPIGGAMAGGWLASLGAGLLCGPDAPICIGAIIMFGGGLGAGGGLVADRQVNIARHSAETAQAARTGLALVTQDEWENRSSRWKFGLYASMVLGAPMGPVGETAGTLGKALLAKGASASAMSAAEGTIAVDLSAQLSAGLKTMGRSVVKGMKAPGSMWRMGIAGFGIAADMVTDENYDLKLDMSVNNMLGWGGGALLWNEAMGTYILGVSASGQVVSLVMNTAGEVGIQALQDRPITRPDGKRCFVSNMFSTLATGLVRKPVLMGRRHFGSFVFGKEVLLPIAERFPRVSNALRSVTRRKGAVKQWIAPPNLTIAESKYTQLLRGVALDDFMAAHPNTFSSKWIPPSAATRYRFQLREGLTQAEFDQLRINVEGKWSATTARDGTVRYNLANTNGDIAVNNWLSIHQMDHVWQWQKGTAGQVGTFRLKSGVQPTAIPEELQQSLQPIVGEWRAVETSGGLKYVWAKPRIAASQFEQVENILTGVGVGKWSPQLTVRGMMDNLGPYLGGVLALNAVAGARAQEADPYYQPVNRVFDYGFGAVLTEPFMKAPLGIDTVRAQLVGYSMALASRAVLNPFFPTYSEPWIGRHKHFERLEDGDLDGAYAVTSRNMTSLTTPMSPLLDSFIGNNGTVTGTMWRLEYRAIHTLRKEYDALFEAAVSRHAMGSGMPDVAIAERRLKMFARMLDHQLVALEEESVDLDDGRLTLVLAAYVQSRLGNSFKKTGKVPMSTDVMGSFVPLLTQHKAIFDQLPTLPNSNEVWEQWIKSVNDGKLDHLIKS
ncbi:MAG: hypothetical protein COV45_08155 [Deltaproteobacteria bacterium CG11_big_fil_rev_8_21_14_0_20_47_16]|nr:MAG: hypothetical protein COV45_08155 [Deltaproteobacteria bacterium CG11_big_fil_rev_8_21_14_0_20_47_16]